MAEDNEYTVYYWREASGEVDFVVSGNGECVAIEVKSGRRKANSGLFRFAEAFRPKRAFVVGTGGVPLEDFLRCDISRLIG